MDTDFTRTRAKGTTAGAQDEIGPDMICGELPRGFDARSYATRPWTITRWIHECDRLDLGDRVLEILSTPGHTPDAVSLLDREHGLLSPATPITPGRSGCFDPKPISMRTPPATRRAHLASHDGSRRAQRAERTAPDPAPARQRVRRCPSGASFNPREGRRQEHIPRGRDLVRAARSTLTARHGVQPGGPARAVRVHEPGARVVTAVDAPGVPAGPSCVGTHCRRSVPRSLAFVARLLLEPGTRRAQSIQ